MKADPHDPVADENLRSPGGALEFRYLESRVAHGLISFCLSVLDEVAGRPDENEVIDVEPVDLEPVGGYRPIPAPQPQSPATPWWRLLRARFSGDLGELFFLVVCAVAVLLGVLMVTVSCGGTPELEREWTEICVETYECVQARCIDELYTEDNWWENYRVCAADCGVPFEERSCDASPEVCAADTAYVCEVADLTHEQALCEMRWNRCMGGARQ